jgi:hypothetical protein
MRASVLSPRRSFAATAAVIILVSCGAATRPTPAPTSILLPGSPLLRAGSRSARTIDHSVTRFRPGIDSTEQPLTHVQTFQGPASIGADCLLIMSAWPPPFSSTDSLVVDRRTLAPVREILSIASDRYEYAYAAGRVTGSISRRDSVVRLVEQSFAQPVFAFNEVKALVQALDFRPNLQLIIPLFSEVDGSVEHDTLTVLNHAAPTIESTAWIVRFADPAITSIYRVDPRTRAVLDLTTRNRKTGTAFHIRPNN